MYEGHQKHKYTEWPHAGRSGGFTLIELMITVAVAAILITVAIPAYQSMVQRNSMTSVVNTLVGALNYARSEAVTRGTLVYICASEDQATCGGDWLDGWIVYAPEYPDYKPKSDSLLRAHDAINAPQLTVTDNIASPLVLGGNNPVIFGGSGFLADGSGATLTLATEHTDDVTCVVIASTGRIHTETGYYGSTSVC